MAHMATRSFTLKKITCELGLDKNASIHGLLPCETSTLKILTSELRLDMNASVLELQAREEILFSGSCPYTLVFMSSPSS